MEITEIFPKRPGRKSPVYGRPIVTIYINEKPIKINQAKEKQATIYFPHEAIEFLGLEPGQRIRLLKTRVNPEDKPAFHLWLIPNGVVNRGYTVNKSGRHTAMVAKFPTDDSVEAGHYEILEAKINPWYPERYLNRLTLISTDL